MGHIHLQGFTCRLHRLVISPGKIKTCADEDLGYLGQRIHLERLLCGVERCLVISQGDITAGLPAITGRTRSFTRNSAFWVSQKGRQYLFLGSLLGQALQALSSRARMVGNSEVTACRNIWLKTRSSCAEKGVSNALQGRRFRRPEGFRNVGSILTWFRVSASHRTLPRG